MAVRRMRDYEYDIDTTARITCQAQALSILREHDPARERYRRTVDASEVGLNAPCVRRAKTAEAATASSGRIVRTLGADLRWRTSRWHQRCRGDRRNRQPSVIGP